METAWELGARGAARGGQEPRTRSPAGFPRAAAVARVLISGPYFTAAADTIQLHGGIGFTWEHDAHLYYKNALSGKVLLGGPGDQLDRLAADARACRRSRAPARPPGMTGTMQRAEPPPSPAVPSTPAQHGRHDRILEAATAMLAAGGEDALQMKELSQRADVSLATLYRYFPAKDHVLLAITLSRYERALTRVRGEPPRGGHASASG